MSTTDATTYPYPSGDAVILGPETFADKGKTVICHQGENYYPRPLADDTYVAEDADGTPCLWLLTPGGNGRTELLASKDDVRVMVNVHKPNASWGAPSRDVYVDRLWDAIAATAGEAPKDDADA